MSVLDEFTLHGKTAIVTGSSKGIGRALAVALAEAGADICLVNRSEREGRLAAEEIAAETGVETLAVPADVTDEDDVEAMVEATLDAFGSIDILVNNAGIARTAPAHEMSLETWNEVLQTNLTGVFLCTKHAGKAMIDGGGGTIVNMASMSAFVANYPQEEVVYHASKGGVVSFTRQLASEWAKYDVRANAMAPGYIRTEMVDELLAENPDMESAWLSEMLMEEMAPPEDLGGTVVYLASDASSYMTGETVVIDGGYTVR
ncbi:SDR family NAD(P)-dependent oxidoreductase [Haloferax sulfurifontis]|uniref:Short-chain dehydrogenase/reductase SDR n=2 Tax=Haloferax sulfurifontis TaxID=255616 RepID=M0HZ41_9EURY|nr:SDR family NAD(P)-dependent oxidoreductase [Haloferax sulfurifontis]ELZ89761.1 short-chain dehydrogenase/reductase SDR [Haloferax sulfurifontis ATCC BAA-897]GGC50708.1 oxidoreductase [Haloferax sulfurifontis]